MIFLKVCSVGTWAHIETIHPRAAYQFYKVLQNSIDKVTPVTYNEPITLTSIDPITAAVSPVNTINRNDFINIVVTVSFNKDAGELEFEVSEWKNKSGEITFN